MQRAWDDETHDADFDYDSDDNAVVAVAAAGTHAIWSGDPMMRRVVNSYVVQIKRGESIYAYPDGGWPYGQGN